MPPQPFSINEHIRRFITFPDPWTRIAGLQTARQAVEEQLAFLKAQRGVQIKAQITGHGDRMAHEDREDMIDEYRRVVDELFPKIFRGGYVISLWSVFESSVKNIAEYTRKEQHLPFGLHELRAGDFLEQVDVFFDRVLSVKAFPDKSVRTRLAELKGLRNALAHHDGNVSELPKSLRAKSSAEYLRKGLLTFRDLHHEYAVPTSEYVETNLALVKQYLEQLTETVYAALHPTPLTDDA